jgi:hypothetical protein
LATAPTALAGIAGARMGNAVHLVGRGSARYTPQRFDEDRRVPVDERLNLILAGTSSENLRRRELDNFEQLCALQHAGDLLSQSPVDLIATIAALIPALQAASAPDPAIAAKINRQNRQQDA